MVTKGERGWGRGKSEIWDQQIQTTIYKIDTQQGPLYSTEKDNSVTEVTDLNQIFLKSNMKAKRYKPASRQDIRTKAFQKSIFEGTYWFIHSIIKQSFTRHQLAERHSLGAGPCVSVHCLGCKGAHKYNVFCKYEKNSSREKEKIRLQRE